MEVSKSLQKIEAVIINGDLGAGKTRVGKLLAENLGFTFLSTGDFFRKEAESRGISFQELHELMKKDLSIDKKIDERVKEYLATNQSYIVDSRMGAFFEPRAFRVLLKVDEKEGAQRILNDMKTNPARVSEKVNKLEKVIAQNRHRLESEKMRYQSLYQVDHTDEKYYNIVINTSGIRPEEVVHVIEVDFHIWKHQAVKQGLPV